MLARKHLIFILLILAPLPVAANVQARLTYLEQQNTQLRQTVLDQAVKIFELLRETQSLQGQIEVLNHQLEIFSKSQEHMKLDVEKRLGELKKSLTKEISTPSESLIPLEPTTLPPEPLKAQLQVLMDNDKEAYQQVFEVVKTGSSEDAIAGLKEFLRVYPQSDYADNAQYWLGEMYYTQKEFDSALTAFSNLLEKYPNSSKHSEALLKIGYVYYKKKDYDTAKAIFQQVMETVPGTVTADLADKRLQKMPK